MRCPTLPSVQPGFDQTPPFVGVVHLFRLTHLLRDAMNHAHRAAHQATDDCGIQCRKQKFFQAHLAVQHFDVCRVLQNLGHGFLRCFRHHAA